MSPTKRHSRYRIVTKGERLSCAGCGDPITKHYVRDLTKQPWHPACRRLGASVRKLYAPPPPRYLGHVDQACEGCDTPITDSDTTVTVSAVPWHKECYMRR